MYALENNPNAIVTLWNLVRTEWANENVKVIESDMRYWEPEEIADIIVSELLGSFGDNSLCFRKMYSCLYTLLLTRKDLNSWLPMYFPINSPLFTAGGNVQIHVWTCCSSEKVWYELEICV